MNLSWAIHRVSSMSVPEVTFRLREQMLRKAMRATSKGWAVFTPAPGFLPIIPGLRDRVLVHMEPALRSAVQASADALLDGRFEAFGCAWPQRANGLVYPSGMWSLDPLTHKSWPADRYCFDIDYKHGAECGDIKYAWQLNRLQFLPPLATAAATGDTPRAGLAMRNALSSWMSANEPFLGICWNSGIELALRSVSVILAVSLCPDVLDDLDRLQLRRFLTAHLYWLKRYPSRYSSANNHCVAEALGGYVIGTVMPDLPGAAAHARESRELLCRQALIQLQPDGSPAEQSLVYGAFTAEMLVLAALVARSTGDDFPQEVLDRLVAFAHAVAVFATPSGRTPDLGDDDDTRVISLCHRREAHYPVSVARAICAFCDAPAPDMSPPCPELRDAVFGSPTQQRPDSTGLHTFPFGGYSVVSERRQDHTVKLVLDHGPLGFLSIAAHGHADATSIILTLNEEPVLVDPGTYLYHSGGPWRDWFRSTPAHNTLNIGGLSQSTMTGAFNWGRKAQAHLVSAISGDAWTLVAQHDGYVRPFGVQHERQVSALPHGLRITDRLLPQGLDRPVEVVFQFAPGLDVSCSGRSCEVSKEGMLLLSLTFDREGQLDVHKGEPGSFLGWVSPCFGSRVPAARLSWTGLIDRDGLTTTLHFVAGAASQIASLGE